MVKYLDYGHICLLIKNLNISSNMLRRTCIYHIKLNDYWIMQSHVCLFLYWHKLIRWYMHGFCSWWTTCPLHFVVELCTNATWTKWKILGSGRFWFLLLFYHNSGSKVNFKVKYDFLANKAKYFFFSLSWKSCMIADLWTSASSYLT